MKGRVFKRCSGCGRRVRDRTCDQCRSRSISWAYRASIGRDENGRWREQYRSGFATKREAERALAAFLNSLHEGTYVTSTGLTLGEYLTQEWLAATAPPRVGQGTWNDRKRNLEHHVIEHLGSLRLQALTTAHINRLYATLLSDGRRDGEGGLSPTTVRRIHSILRKALNDAVRWGLLERNPVLVADPPPARVDKSAQRRRMRTWSAEELRRFLESTVGHPLYPAWFLAASTGVRRSELLGLPWSDVDLEAAQVQVRQTVVDGEDGTFVLLAGENKSDTSARTIHLDRRTVDVLRSHKENQDEMRPWFEEDHDLAFPRHDGRWWNPPAISLAFRRVVQQEGLPKIRFHDLRHSHATLLLRAGVNPKVVSERLGHSSVAFTLDTYAHVLPGMQPEAAEQLMSLVFNDDDGTDPQPPAQPCDLQSGQTDGDTSPEE